MAGASLRARRTGRTAVLATYPGSALGVRGATVLLAAPDRISAVQDWPSVDACMAAALRCEADQIVPPPDAAGPADLHRLALWTIAALQLCRVPVPPGHSVEHGPEGYRIALPCLQPEATETAFVTCCHLLDEMARARTAPRRERAAARALQGLETALGRFVETGQNRTLLLLAAHDRGVPVTLGLRTDAEVVYGIGRHALALESTMSDAASPVGVAIARHKIRTAECLRRAGLPVTEGIAVASLAEARAAAEALAWPVVVKPRALDRGEGVFADIRDMATLEWAFLRARRASPHLMVERHVPGDHVRLTLYRDHVLSATFKRPGGVTGDGVSTVDQLVAAEQARREAERRARKARGAGLQMDDEARGMLAQQGLAPSSVPEEGRFVPLRRRSNATSGGTTTHIGVDDVHPDNLDLCREAARLLGLDLAGIDLITPDAGRSWTGGGTVICDVNARPQLGFEAARELMAHLFCEGGRIPVHALIVGDPADVSDDALSALAAARGCDGISSAHGLWLDGRRSPRRHATHFEAARRLLCDTRVTSALCVLPLHEVVQRGWPVDRLDCVVLHPGTAADPAALARLEATLLRHAVRVERPGQDAGASRSVVEAR